MNIVVIFIIIYVITYLCLYTGMIMEYVGINQSHIIT